MFRVAACSPFGLPAPPSASPVLVFFAPSRYKACWPVLKLVACVEFTSSAWAVAYADHVARCAGGDSNHAAHEWAADDLSGVCHDVKSALGVGVQILTDPPNASHKIQKYDEGVRNAAGTLRLVPFAVSEFGSLAPHAEAFLVDFAKASHKHIGQKFGQLLGRGRTKASRKREEQRRAAAAAAGVADAGERAAARGRAQDTRQARIATQQATSASERDALTAKIKRLNEEGEALRAAAERDREAERELRSRLVQAEEAALQSRIAAHNAREKLYHYRYNVTKRKRGDADGESDGQQSDGEGSGEEEEPGSADDEPKPPVRRNRPTGLHYKLRKGSQVAKDSIDIYIRKKRDDLEHLLTNMFGSKWEEYYRQNGTGEQLTAGVEGDESSSGGGADVGTCNPSPLGKTHRSYTHMPRWVLRSLFSKYRHLLRSIFDDMGHDRQTEEAAKRVMEQHWRENAVKIYTDICSTARAWKQLKTMLSNRKDPNVDYWTPLLWPCGTEAPGAPGLDWILSRIREHMEKLRVDSANLCCKVYTRSVIVDRLEFVDNMGLLPPPGSTIPCQHLIDATGLFKNPRTNSTSGVAKCIYDDSSLTDESQKVNSVNNHVLLTFFLRDDCWTDLQLHASHIPDDLKQLQREGVHVNGKHYNIKVLAGGDMKILSGLLGHCGCSSLFPCIYCIVGSHAERAMTLQQWEAAGISMRDMEELVQLTHTVMGSRCPSTKCKDRDVTASSAELADEGMSVSRRQQLQQLHYGMCRGRAPYLVLSHILDYIVDILHLMLRVVPQIFKFTVSKHCDAAKQLELVKWVEEHLKVKLSSSKAGQSATGKAKIDLSAESWPGETCQVLMDNYVAILQKAIPLWRSRHKHLYINAKKVWDLFFELYYMVTHGCDDKDEAAVQQHATEVEEVGNKMLTAFLQVANQQDVTVYIHVSAVHLGQMIRRHGSLGKWCS
eukprot:jgi/Tetstr1/433637/TSEL_000008.t1